MEGKNFSSESENEIEKKFSSVPENEIEKEMINIKDFEKLLREEISKCLKEEKKKNKTLEQKLFEVEVELFEDVVDELKAKPGRPSKKLYKLEDMIRTYCTIKEVNKKIRLIKSRYKYYCDEKVLSLS